MRIYIVDEMNKPILSDASLTCNDKDYIITELTGGTYIDVDDSASGQYHISNIGLYKVGTDKLLPYSIQLKNQLQLLVKEYILMTLIF